MRRTVKRESRFSALKVGRGGGGKRCNEQMLGFVLFPKATLNYVQVFMVSFSLLFHLASCFVLPNRLGYVGDR